MREDIIENDFSLILILSRSRNVARACRLFIFVTTFCFFCSVSSFYCNYQCKTRLPLQRLESSQNFAAFQRSPFQIVSPKHSKDCFSRLLLRLRPHHREKTGSRPITEVKPCRAGLVLGWVTAWEYPVL